MSPEIMRVGRSGAKPRLNAEYVVFNTTEYAPLGTAVYL